MPCMLKRINRDGEIIGDIDFDSWNFSIDDNVCYSRGSFCLLDESLNKIIPVMIFELLKNGPHTRVKVTVSEEGKDISAYYKALPFRNFYDTQCDIHNAFFADFQEKGFDDWMKVDLRFDLRKGM